MAQNKVKIEKEGVVLETLPNAMFRVEIDDETGEKKTILCLLSGKMRMYRIRVMPGDVVKVELTPYDANRGRITYRNK